MAFLGLARRLKNAVVPDRAFFLKIPFGLCKGFYFPLNFRHDVRFYFGMYEKEITPFFEKLVQNGDCCYDVGSERGYYAMALSALSGPNGKIVAIESEVKTFQLLQRTLARNECLQTSTATRALVLPLRLAIGDQVSESNNFFTLDALVFGRKYPIPNFIKMDVEGHELKALWGAKKIIENSSPRFVIEIHSKELERSCKAFLKERGYDVAIVPRRPGNSERRLLPYNQWMVAQKPPKSREGGAGGIG
jgi:hypothetical protein